MVAVINTESPLRRHRGSIWLNSWDRREIKHPLQSAPGAEPWLKAWIAEGTGRAALAFAETEGDQALAQVNLWLARAGRLGDGAVRDEVVAWDPKNLGPKFQLAKLVLTGDDKAAIDLVGSLLAADVLSKAELATLPLFRRLRQQGLFDQFN